MKRKLKDGSVAEIDPKFAETKNLLKILAAAQAAILAEESNGQKVFSTKNLVGEWAEILCCEKLGLTQEIPSNEGWDATDGAGRRYQIKARMDNDGNGGDTTMGDVSDQALSEIDFVICAFMNKDFTAKRAYLIPASRYKDFCVKRSEESKHARPNRLILSRSTAKKLEADGIADISEILNK